MDHKTHSSDITVTSINDTELDDLDYTQHRQYTPLPHQDYIVASDPYKQSVSFENSHLESLGSKFDPIGAVLIFLAVAAITFVHHWFLDKLNGEPVDQFLKQDYTQQISIFISLIVQLGLVMVCGTALQQVQWFILRKSRNGIKVSAIDALFTIDQGPLNMLSWGLWKTATLAIPVAALIYSLPLVNVFAPTALTVMGKPIFGATICRTPQVDFLPGQNRSGLELFFLDYTSDIWQGESSRTKRLATLTALEGQVQIASSPCGTNCSFTTQFYGPSMRCYDVDRQNKSAPWQDVWWYGNKTAEETPYDYEAANFNFYGAKIYSADFDTTFDEALWIGHRYTRNGTSTSPAISTDSPLPKNATVADLYGFEFFTCQSWNTSFTTNFTYSGSNANAEITNITYINQVTTAFYENGTSVTSSSYNYRAIYRSIANLLIGSISAPYKDVGLATTNMTSINIMPGLTEPDEYIYDGRSPQRSIRAEVEELSRNVTMSFFTAQDLQTYIGTMDNTCDTTNYIQAWRYNKVTLWLPYAIALGLTMILMLLAGLALVSNGRPAPKATFSTVIRATASSGLEDVLREDHAEKTLLRMRMKYAREIGGGRQSAGLKYIRG